MIARRYLYSQFHFIAAQGIIGENQENVEAQNRERMILAVNLVIGSQCWLCERNIFIVLITLRFTQTLSCHLIWLVGRCIELGLSAVRSVCGQMEDVRD